MSILISCLLIVVGLATMMAPFLAYVIVGWKAKRKDIMDGFDKDARLAYFKMFSRSEEAPSLDTAVVNFETLYSQWYGRRFFWVPGILLFVVTLDRSDIHRVDGTAYPRIFDQIRFSTFHPSPSPRSPARICGWSTISCPGRAAWTFPLLTFNGEYCAW